MIIMHYQKEMDVLFSALIEFSELPCIGFAHHFYTKEYNFTYGHMNNNFEIAYVKSGGIEAELYGQKIIAPEGSIFVLFRHLPISVRSVDNTHQSHCTVQAEFDYSFEIVENDIPGSNKIILPFVTLPCPETEIIKKILYSIVSDIGVSRQEYAFSSSIKFLEIMTQLDKLARRNLHTNSPDTSITVYKIKKYIANNINKDISLSDISSAVGLTSNYINHIFKNSEGIPIKQYVNNQKATKITEFIQTQQVSFKTACDNVGISDYSYGYRLFKKHTGMTPGSFVKSSFSNIRK